MQATEQLSCNCRMMQRSSAAWMPRQQRCRAFCRGSAGTRVRCTSRPASALSTLSDRLHRCALTPFLLFLLLILRMKLPHPPEGNKELSSFRPFMSRTMTYVRVFRADTVVLMKLS